MVFLAYQGFGLITNAAEDIINPEMTLPRAISLSIVLVIIITMGAQRVTNTLTFTGCPTITITDKKTTKRRHLRHLN